MNDGDLSRMPGVWTEAEVKEQIRDAIRGAAPRIIPDEPIADGALEALAGGLADVVAETLKHTRALRDFRPRQGEDAP